MFKRLLSKIKEASFSVLPISFLVLILVLTPLINLNTQEIWAFVISTIGLILGIALFNLGADLGIEPMGQQVGSTLIKTKKMKLILIVCFILGLLITVAEPDLTVLANQLKNAIPSFLNIPGNIILVLSIGLGVGIFIVIGVMKIITKKDLCQILLFFYMMLFAFASISTPPEEIVTWPCSGRMRPRIRRIIVVLPSPEGPTKATISPGSTIKSEFVMTFWFSR